MPRLKYHNILNREVDYPFNSICFLRAWITWKLDRKERKIRAWKYTTRGEQTALHALYAEAEGDQIKAMAIIATSIANGWQGLFRYTPRIYELVQKKYGERKELADRVSDFIRQG